MSDIESAIEAAEKLHSLYYYSEYKTVHNCLTKQQARIKELENEVNALRAMDSLDATDDLERKANSIKKQCI